MTLSTSSASPGSTPPRWTTAPVIDCEPAPEPLGRLPGPSCPTPSADTLHRRSPRTRRPPLHLCEPPPPKSAVIFAETALRQVIEVIDRRRPVAQLRPLMTPALIDGVIAQAGATRRGSATIRRVRVRAVDPRGAGTDQNGEVCAAEVFASFMRAGRVHAVAARIERHRDRWRMVALQIG
ncbi:MAG: hypothetical protein KDB44_02510 [Mycobacterium sp.]|nr:hypothetical protein [Mycobacterium sp.]